MTCTIWQRMRCIGMSRARTARAPGRSEHAAQPQLLASSAVSPGFERRIFCDLDPSEIFYWMTKMEMGQSHHHEFWTIGLNVHGRRLPVCRNRHPLQRGEHFIRWPIRNFFSRSPGRRSRNSRPSGNGIGAGESRWTGEFPDLSKKFAFEPYLDLPRRVPEAHFELAMNLNADDPGDRATARARLARRLSASRRADAARVSALLGERAGRIHRDQRRRRGLADRVVERSRGGVSRARAAGDHGRYRRGEISAARERVSFRSTASRKRKRP